MSTPTRLTAAQLAEIHSTTENTPTDTTTTNKDDEDLFFPPSTTTKQKRGKGYSTLGADDNNDDDTDQNTKVDGPNAVGYTNLPPTTATTNNDDDERAEIQRLSLSVSAILNQDTTTATANVNDVNDQNNDQSNDQSNNAATEGEVGTDKRSNSLHTPIYFARSGGGGGAGGTASTSYQKRNTLSVSSSTASRNNGSAANSAKFSAGSTRLSSRSVVLTHPTEEPVSAEVEGAVAAMDDSAEVQAAVKSVFIGDDEPNTHKHVHVPPNHHHHHHHRTAKDATKHHTFGGSSKHQIHKHHTQPVKQETEPSAGSPPSAPKHKSFHKALFTRAFGISRTAGAAPASTATATATQKPQHHQLTTANKKQASPLSQHKRQLTHKGAHAKKSSGVRGSSGAANATHIPLQDDSDGHSDNHDDDQPAADNDASNNDNSNDNSNDVDAGGDGDDGHLDNNDDDNNNNDNDNDNNDNNDNNNVADNDNNDDTNNSPGGVIATSPKDPHDNTGTSKRPTKKLIATSNKSNNSSSAFQSKTLTAQQMSQLGSARQKQDENNNDLSGQWTARKNNATYDLDELRRELQAIHVSTDDSTTTTATGSPNQPTMTSAASAPTASLRTSTSTKTISSVSSSKKSPQTHRHYPSLKKGVQKRLGVGKYSQTGGIGFFGVPLQSQPVDESSGLPLLMLAALKYLYTNKAYLEEGIFRIAGGAETTNRLAKACDKAGKLVIERKVLDAHQNPHDISSLVKLWLKMLPEPLIPPATFTSLTKAYKSTSSDELRISHFASGMASTMPPRNKTALKHFLYFMALVAANAEENKMHLGNVVACLAPTVMRAETDRDFLLNFEASSGCVMFLLKNLEAVFGTYSPLPFMREHLTALGFDDNGNSDVGGEGAIALDGRDGDVDLFAPA